MEPPWEGGKKFYINGSGHMAKMTAMPIYGKNFEKSSPTDLIVLCSSNLAWGIMYSNSTKVYINDDPVLTLTHFNTMSNLAKPVFVHKVGPNIR